jgi:multiple RNA-binding domain-containing protein 1
VDGGAAAAAAGDVDDPKLAEFLELMQPRAKAKIWSNDEVIPAGGAAMPFGADVPLPHSKRRPMDGGDELPDDGAVAPPADAGADSDEDYQDDSSSSDGSEMDVLAGKDSAVVDEGVSDLDYLRSRMRHSTEGIPEHGRAEDNDGGSSSDGEDDGASSSSGDGENVDMQEEEEEEEEAGSSDDGGEAVGGRGDQTGVGPSSGGRAAAAAAARAAAEAQVLDTGRLFVRNLAYGATEAELSELFGVHGPLEEVHLVTDRCVTDTSW